MAGLWETVKLAGRTALYGPAPAAYLSPARPIERREAALGYPVIPNHVLTTSDYIRAGGLIHGPGATEALRRAWELGCDFNPVASICLFRVMTDFGQAPLRVYRALGGGKRDVVEAHPLSELLKRPNPNMTRTLLWQHTAYVLNAHGNAYWRKIRAGNKDTGNVVALWPVSPDRCAPTREKGSKAFIDYYTIKNGPAKADEEYVPVGNIVHFRFGIDDRNHMLGISRLRRVLREVTADDEAAEFVNRLLRNGAVPGLVILTDATATMDAAGAASVKESIEAAFTGGNQGRAAVMSPAVRDAKQLGFDPKQMDIGPMTDRAEALICGVIGVPAQVAGIPLGIHFATYSNFEQANESYTSLTLLPQYPAVAETLDTQLLPDFSGDPQESTGFDTGEMRALQEDEDAKAKRIALLFQSDMLTLDEGRSELGYEPAVDATRGKQYYSDVAARAVIPKLPNPPVPEGRSIELVRHAG